MIQLTHTDSITVVTINANLHEKKAVLSQRELRDMPL